MAAEPATSSQDSFQKLEDYPWSSDQEFQAGLKAILGPEPDKMNPEQLDDLSLRARCFYFSRKHNISTDFDAYKQWRKTRRQGTSASPAVDPGAVKSAGSETRQPAASAEEPAASLSFAEVMDLVQNSKPVPGVQDVPDTVLEGQATQATKAERKKPWEQARTNEQAAGSGLFAAPSS